MDSTRATAGDILLLDCGDATGVYNVAGTADSMKFGFTVQQLARMGYDAFLPGEREIGFGVKRLVASAAKAKLTIVASNVAYKSNPKKLLGKESVVFKKSGLRVAVFGVMGTDVQLTYPSYDRDSLIVLDAVATAKRLVPQLRKKADVVVMLAHTSYFPAQKIAQDVPGIDVVIVGHAPGQGEVAPTATGPIYARSGQRGQNIARTTVDVEGGRITNLASAVVSLGGTVRADEATLAIVKEFEDGLNAQQKSRDEEVAKAGATTQNQPAADRYLGAATCGRCHAATYEQWKGTGHAHAMETLTKAKQDANAECVKCHVVGFGEPNGFVSLAATPVLKDVQCEQCHGMATLHSEYKDVTEETCTKCHTPERDPGWNFETRWGTIAHQ